MPVLTPTASTVAEIATSDSTHYVPRHSTQGRVTESGLTVVPWSRWGLRRLYVNTADGEQVGWVDLDTWNRVLTMPEREATFDAALREIAGSTVAAPYAPRRGLDHATLPATADLSENRPGQHLEEKIASVLESGGDLEPASPDFQGRHAYSSWELGVLGEQVVAQELDRLVARDGRWSYVNSIAVGTREADIDHVAVGPGGVFTLNAKHHHDGEVWVGGDALMVNQVWKHYIRDSRAEAARAARLLSTATGGSIAVSGLVVPVGVRRLTVREQPSDVTVVGESDLVDYLAGRPRVLDDETIALVVTCARSSATWTPDTSGGRATARRPF